jgi:hypothetical protein
MDLSVKILFGSWLVFAIFISGLSILDKIYNYFHKDKTTQ